MKDVSKFKFKKGRVKDENEVEKNACVVSSGSYDDRSSCGMRRHNK